jgi:DNA segregation ATPase FtsK/SpoIIIE-like protein
MEKFRRENMNKYLTQAKALLTIHGKLSAVFLQRKLKIGYQEAIQILITLELI